MGIGILFPGQASQFAGMGKGLYDAYPVARRVFEEASDALSEDIASLCFRGTDEDLRMTEKTQPAIFTVSLAAFRVLTAETEIQPVCAAGHSLGEYSALVAADVMPIADVVRALRSRGRYMQEAVPIGEGAMAAVIGLTPEQIDKVCEQVSAFGIVSPANFNGGNQIVVSGASKAVAAACEAAKAAGAKRALRLPVSAPFHCALMQPAADRLGPELQAIPQKAFRFPVVANVTASPYISGIAVADVLIRQITAPVRWEESVRTMQRMGAASFLEVGPGRVLSGLVQRIDKMATVAAFCSPADIREVWTLLA